MTKFRIISKDGIDFGLWEAPDAAAAFAAMVDAGVEGVDCDGASTAGSVDDWYIEEE